MKRFPLVLLAMGVVFGVAIGLMLAPFLITGANVNIPIWLEVVQRVCTSVGGLGTFFALIFVVRQFRLLRTQSELLQTNVRASMDGELYSRLDSFNKFIVDHDKEYEMLNQAYQPEAPPDHRYRLNHLCELGFTFFEEIFKHHKRYGLLDEEDWEEWRQNMAHFFSKPYVRGFWPKIAFRFARSFQDFANSLLAEDAAGAKARA